MKKKIAWILTLSLIILSTGCAVHGYVTTRPADVYYDRPAAPGVDFVWISGNWSWAGGKYIWHEGHWARKRSGHEWHEGHWEHHGRGWRWHKGHW